MVLFPLPIGHLFILVLFIFGLALINLIHSLSLFCFEN
jgi:hypothetical protein